MYYIVAKQLVDKAVEQGILQKLGDNIAVYHEAGERAPEGWYLDPYEEVIHEVMDSTEAQNAICEALKEKGIDFDINAEQSRAKGTINLLGKLIGEDSEGYGKATTLAEHGKDPYLCVPTVEDDEEFIHVALVSVEILPHDEENHPGEKIRVQYRFECGENRFVDVTVWVNAEGDVSSYETDEQIPAGLLSVITAMAEQHIQSMI